MLKITEKSRCSGCFGCYNACPKKCIEMKADGEGFLYPVIDEKSCIDCHRCEKVCPVINSQRITKGEPVAFAAKNNNEDQRNQSSSGGIFLLLAEQIIASDGAVFGVALTEDCKKAVHENAETFDGIDKFKGSKYLQSAVGDTYKEAEDLLKQGKKVLFTGTPCQIAGLYSFCGKEYDNLYTCDIICHGVPSPLVWEKYVELREKEADSKAKKVLFRKKDKGWETFSLHFEFESAKTYTKTFTADLYGRGFLENIYLRPSCYDCSFKGIKRASDITLADFWGVEKVAPLMNDKKGTSLIFVNTKKGQELLEEINQKVSLYSVSAQDAVKYNSAAIKSAPLKEKKRAAFFKAMEKMPFSKLMNKYCAVKKFDKIKKKIKGLLRRIKSLIKA